MRFQQLLAHSTIQSIDTSMRPDLRYFEKQLAGKRVSVRVQTDRRQTNQQVAVANRFSIEYARPVDHTDNETCNVVFTVRIETRHLGGFSTDQSATGFLA